MDKKEFLETLKVVKDVSPKRNFKQTVDLIVNLKGINVKKDEENINHYLVLHTPNKPEVKVCALVGQALSKKADVCQRVILESDFSNLEKKELKKLAREFDFFVAQADIMPKIASTFGRYLGPLKKMPNPKIGCIIPPTGDVKQVFDRLQKTTHLLTKNEPSVKVSLGSEEYEEDKLADNAVNVYNTIVHDLPNHKHNIRAVYLKFTMGPCVKIGETKEEFMERKNQTQEEKTEDTKKESKPKEAKKQEKKEAKEEKKKDEQTSETKEAEK